MEDSRDTFVVRLGDLTSRDAVLAAMREFDEIGREPFLKKYGFGDANQYMVVHEERLYDPKAIAGAAHAHQFPEKGPLTIDAISGGIGAAMGSESPDEVRGVRQAERRSIPRSA